MTIKERIEQDIKTAMKERRRERLDCLRMLKSRLQEREVALRGERPASETMTDAEATEVIAAYAKQRRDSIDSFRQAARQELVDKEQRELEIVQEYLPRQLSEAELAEIVRQAIADSGATSPRDMGQVMKLVAPRTKGLADGKQVSQLVQRLLAAPR